MSRDNKKANKQFSFVKWVVLLAVAGILSAVAAAADTTGRPVRGPILKGSISVAGTESYRRVSGGPLRLTVHSGGSAPTIQAVQRYINPTYLTVHTTTAFDSSGGDLLVMYASSHENVVFSPSDNYGNAWISVAGPTNTADGFDLRSQIWCVPQAKVGPTHTVTVQLSKKQPLVFAVFVVKGADPQAPIQAISGIGSDHGSRSVNVSSPPVSTTAANELLLGWAKVSAGASFRSGKSFLPRNDASSDFLDAESETLTLPGTHEATFTMSASQTWQSAVVAIAPKSSHATLSWAPVSSGFEYLIERCAGAGCDAFEQVGVTAKNQYVDTNLEPRSSYSYRVRSRDREGKLGAHSRVASVILSSAGPSLPANLRAAGISPTKIRLSWVPAAGLEMREKYLIERCLGNGCTNFSFLASSTRANFTDSGLVPGATYNYRVRTVDTAGYCSPALCVAQSTTLVPHSIGYIAFFAMASVAPWYKRAWKFFD